MRTPTLVFALFVLAIVAIVAFAGLPDRGPSRALATNVTSFASGGDHNCATVAGGRVQCWGSNSQGQLGDGTQLRRTAPVDVCQTYNAAQGTCTQFLAGATQLALGGQYSCAIVAGGVDCWGSNFSGHLGDGGDCGGICPTPVAVCANASCSAALTGATVIDAGDDHTCAVVAGALKCWGANGRGQLGDNSTVMRTTPVNVVSLSGTVQALALGAEHTCALMSGGGVKCWGSNSKGQLGDALACGNACHTPVDVCADVDCAEPLSGAVAIAAEADHTCAIVSGGHVKCWGDNTETMLVPFAICQQRCEAPQDVCQAYSQPATECAEVVTGATAIVAGETFHCIRTGSGNAACWGLNHEGQLGDNQGCAQTCTTPVTVCGDPTCVVPLSGVSALSAGYNHACAFVGPIKCWGLSTSHQLGDGTKGDAVCGCRTAPVQVQIKVQPTPPPGVTPTRTPTPTPTPPISCVLIGDANGDGNVNAVDATLILQHAAGLIGTLRCQAQADVNGDGNVNAIDATLVLQYVAGFIDTLPP